MNKCGPALVEGHLDQVATFAVEILEKKALCQLDPDQDDDNIDEDSSEYEAALISNAADVFGAMANVLGPDFAQAFGAVLPLIGQYSSPNRANSERSMAIGSLGEIIVGLRKAVTQFTPVSFKILVSSYLIPSHTSEISDVGMGGRYFAARWWCSVNEYYADNIATPSDHLSQSRRPRSRGSLQRCLRRWCSRRVLRSRPLPPLHCRPHCPPALLHRSRSLRPTTL